MTAKRMDFSLVCLPPDEGGLIGAGGYLNVECLDGDGATEWRRLAPLPVPLCSPGGGVYFQQKILVAGDCRTGSKRSSATLAFHPPTQEALANGSP